MRVKLRIGLAQIDPALGLLQRNLDLHRASIAEAERAGVDLLVFPELSLTGYLVKDMVPSLAQRPGAPALEALAAASGRLDIAAGFVEGSDDLRCFNSMAYFAGGRLQHVHRKVYLPTYGMFEEQRFFAAGEAVRAFPTRFGPLALAICEDLWHPSVPYLAFMDGALGLVTASASPVRGMDGSGETGMPVNAVFWSDLLRHYATAYAGFVAFCNRCGFEDGACYWGGSRLLGPDGRILAEAPLYNDSLVIGEVDLGALHRLRQGFSVLRDERPELTLRGLEHILRRRTAGQGTQGEALPGGEP
jgi:predicted amidohydrolase